MDDEAVKEKNHELRCELLPPGNYARDLLIVARRNYLRSRADLRESLAAKRSQLAAQVKALRLRAKMLGKKEGKREAEIECATALLHLTQAYNQQLKWTEEEAIKIAAEIAITVLGEEIPSISQTLASRIRTSLTALIPTASVTIVVNPSELAPLKEELSSLIAREGFEVKTASEIALGKARIETPLGICHLDWEHQLRELSKLVLSEGIVSQHRKECQNEW